MTGTMVTGIGYTINGNNTPFFKFTRDKRETILDRLSINLKHTCGLASYVFPGDKKHQSVYYCPICDEIFIFGTTHGKPDRKKIKKISEKMNDSYRKIHKEEIHIIKEEHTTSKW